MTAPFISPEKTAEMLDGEWINRPDSLASLEWINARSDSRVIREGEVFVALPGTRTDGHDHLEEARMKGALFAVVQRPVSASSLPQLLVQDTVLALREMASLALDSHRSAGHRLVALTGSVGKTTTRELLRMGLMPEGGAHASLGNENNEIGVPLTLLSWPRDYGYCVLEVGVRKPGDMDYLARLLRSDVGIVTAIAPGHLENLGTIEAVWAEKSKLLWAVLPGGHLVVPDPVRQTFASDPLFGDPLREIVVGSLEGVSKGRGTISASLRTGSAMVLRVDQWGVEISLSRPSLALAWCTLLALLAIHALNLDPVAGASRLSGYDGLPGRMERKNHPSGVLLLLDHYNANPASMREAIDWLGRECEVRQGARCFAVLGDMLELGAGSADYHEEMGRQIGRLGLERIWYRGKERESFESGFRQGGGDPARIRAAGEFAEDLRRGRGPAGRDVLLVKGSRGMKLEEVVAPLLEGI